MDVAMGILMGPIAIVLPVAACINGIAIYSFIDLLRSRQIIISQPNPEQWILLAHIHFTLDLVLTRPRIVK